MRANSHHHASKLFAAFFALAFVVIAGLPALRTIAELDSLLARLSIRAAEIGFAVLRVCGI